MNSIFSKNINLPIHQLEGLLFSKHNVSLSILRLDKTDEYISGNKYFKLKYNLQEAQLEGKNTLLTFGGAYSNHIAATAAAGKLFGFKTIGIIRGEEHLPLNPTLSKAIENGMEIHYLDRGTYRNKKEPPVLQNLHNTYGDFFLIPEGGTNDLAIKGTKEIINYIPKDFDTICCAIGTGGTIAGLIESTKKQILGFPALKGDFVQEMVNELLSKQYSNWSLIQDYHFGGYAKTKPELLSFMQKFKNEFNIPLEQIYTGKMLFGIFDLIEKKHFKGGTNILAIHTGGLQGLPR